MGGLALPASRVCRNPSCPGLRKQRCQKAGDVMASGKGQDLFCFNASPQIPPNMRSHPSRVNCWKYYLPIKRCVHGQVQAKFSSCAEEVERMSTWEQQDFSVTLNGLKGVDVQSTSVLPLSQSPPLATLFRFSNVTLEITQVKEKMLHLIVNLKIFPKQSAQAWIS